MLLTKYIEAVRLDLHDTDQDDPNFTTDEITRGIYRAIEDLDRWVPRERIYEATVPAGSISTTQDIGTKPSTFTLQPFIKAGSVVVSASGTTYTIGTDYTVDYSNGTITFPAGSTIANDVTVTITYSTARVQVDISDITDLIHIEQVEYPMGSVPQQFASHALWGDNLFITTGPTIQGSQSQLTEAAHLAIYYYALNTKPSASEHGSIPESLAEPVIKGAGGHCLLIRAIELDFDARDQVDAGVAALAAIDAVQTAITTALNNAKSALDTAADFTDAEAALDVGSLLTDAQTALDAALASLASLHTELTDAVDAADDDLGDVSSILSQVTTYLNQASSPLTAAAGHISGAGAYLTDAETKLDTDIDGQESAIDSLLTNLESGNTTMAQKVTLAESRINASLALVNKVNIGLDPIGDYARMAEIHVNSAALFRDLGRSRVDGAVVRQGLASAYAAAGGHFVSAAAVKAQLANASTNIAQGYINRGQVELEKARSVIELAQARVQIVVALVQGLSAEMDARANLARAYTELVNAKVNSALGYVRLAEARIQNAAGYTQLSGQYVQRVQSYIETANGYFIAAERQATLSDRLRDLGTILVSQFRTILEDFNQTSRRRRLVSNRQ